MCDVLVEVAHDDVEAGRDNEATSTSEPAVPLSPVLESSAVLSVSSPTQDISNGRQWNLSVKPRAELVGSTAPNQNEKPRAVPEPKSRVGFADDTSSKDQDGDASESTDQPVQRCVPKYDYETGQNISQVVSVGRLCFADVNSRTSDLILTAINHQRWLTAVASWSFVSQNYVN